MSFSYDRMRSISTPSISENYGRRKGDARDWEDFEKRPVEVVGLGMPSLLDHMKMLLCPAKYIVFRRIAYVSGKNNRHVRGAHAPHQMLCMGY